VIPGRTLRAVRPPAPVTRMFEDGAVPFDGGAALQVRNSDDGRPLLLVRAGAQDVGCDRRVG
jgi:hypothetical protein